MKNESSYHLSNENKIFTYLKRDQETSKGGLGRLLRIYLSIRTSIVKQLFIFLTLLFCQLTVSADEGLSFRKYNVQSGLSDNFVQSILKDKDGFVWIATLNGLNRYDGYHFKHYTAPLFEAHNNDVRTLWEDAGGNLWIGGAANWCIYNRPKDRVDGDITPVLKEYGIYGKTYFLTVDDKHNLWCAADDTLFLYDFARHQLHRMMLPHGKRVMDVTARGTHSNVLLTNGDIGRIDTGNHKIYIDTQMHIIPGQDYRLHIDTRQRMWVYSLHTAGIFCYDLEHKTWIKDAIEKTISDNLITSVLDDGNGNIWIATDNRGIYVKPAHRGGYEHIAKEAGSPFSLHDNHINSLHLDNNRIIWVGTAKQGIAFAPLGHTSFNLTVLPEQEDIKCLVDSGDGTLWLGLDGEGLLRIDTKLHTRTSYRKEKGDIPSDLIVCNCIDSKGRLWFGTFGGGVFYLQDGRFTIPHIPTDRHGQNPLAQVRRIVQDDNGTLWFATFTNGLYGLNPDGTLDAYTPETSILITASIMDLAYDGGQTLYIGTSSGLYKINVNTRKLLPMKGNVSEQYRLPSPYITCLFEDSRKRLWVGTRKGIAVFVDGSSPKTVLTTNDGLTHNCIRAIAEDRNGTIWVGTDHGLTSIKPTPIDGKKDTERFVCAPYLEPDGIGNITFNAHAVTTTAEGDVLMGGLGQYLRIIPYSYQNNKLGNPAHTVMFTGFRLAGEAMEVGAKEEDGRIPLKTNIQLTKKIELRYSDSNFSFEVSSMDYANLHKQQYLYRLSDKEPWVLAAGNMITFNKLSPGTYRLQVKVKENGGMKDNPVSKMEILIAPPLWKSVPAYIVYLISIIGLIILASYRSQRKRWRMLERQKRDMELAHQHETDEAKLRFVTNVSHDLRTPLALIITPLERLMTQPAAQSMQKDLKLMHRHAATLLNEVNQLLDFRRIDKQKVKLEVSYGNLSGFVKEVCDSFVELSLKDSITITLDQKNDVIDMYFDRNKMQRILLNLLSNAVKYNKKGGSITVTVEKFHTESGNTACIRVADTGIGIRDENKQKIFDRFYQESHKEAAYTGSGIGLHIVREYVGLHHGTIHVEDNQPEGSVFIVTLPVITKETEIERRQPEEKAPHEENSLTVFKDERPVEKKQMPNTDDERKVTILIVEDNDDFRDFLADCMAEDFKVLRAADGKQALGILEQQEVQLVISDVMMPVMDGLALCHAIKSDIRFSHIPVILLTARTAESHIIEGLKEGADDYIAKPFNLEILRMRIRNLLEWTRNSHEKFRTMDVSPSEITVSKVDEELIAKAIGIVEKHIDNSEFSVEELGELLGMSRSNLYKKLSSITGKSPLEFIRIIRLKRGKQILEQSDQPVSQIAYQIGFSPKLFAKYFKEEFGSLPSQWRERQHSE